MHPFQRDAVRELAHRPAAALDPVETLAQVDQLRIAKPGPDPPGIMQGACPVVIAEQQRADPLPSTGWIGKADHDELLPVDAFHLAPAVVAPRPIRPVAALRDDAFDPEAACLRKKSRAVAGVMVAVADHAVGIGRNDPGQRRLAVFERRGGQVPPVLIEEVERIKDQRLGPPGRDLVLHPGESGRAVGVEIDDFAVDHRALDRQRRQTLRQCRKLCGPVEAAAGDQPDGTLVDPGEQAVAVIFDFMEPVGPLRRAVRQLCQLRLHLFGDRRLARAGDPHRTRFRCRFLPRWIGLRLDAARFPNTVALGGDLRHAAARFDAERVFFDDRRTAVGRRLFVALLDQEPIVAAFLRRLSAHSHQSPAAVQFFAVELEFERTLLVRADRVGIERRPAPAVPQQHGPAAILSLRDHPLEPAIFERMVLDMDGETLFARIKARPARHRPAFQCAVELEPKIVMQPARGMLLHDKGERTLLRCRRNPPARRLRRLVEVALALVFGQRHGGPVSAVSSPKHKPSAGVPTDEPWRRIIVARAAPRRARGCAAGNSFSAARTVAPTRLRAWG